MWTLLFDTTAIQKSVQRWRNKGCVKLTEELQTRLGKPKQFKTPGIYEITR